ncbi:hypothetical protein [Lentzea albidocapillata]|uniref:hypothetical protein n=1 Tax=Lentzea albidocapillata TaxID=40571 RepID=UPI0012FCDEDD|nr:hypothetical protein [Lentzea albidocapillata]
MPADRLVGLGPGISQLLHCANAIRIARRRGTETPFSEPARAAAKVLPADLQS